MQEARVYTLDCGKKVTIESMVNETGLSKSTIYDRLNNQGITDYETLIKERLKGSYTDTPQKVYGGIPLNPTYLDGLVKGGKRYDREGNRMLQSTVQAMSKLREGQRKEWLKSADIKR